MSLDWLLQQVKGAVLNHSNQQQETGFNPSGLLNQIEDLFGQHAANTGQQIRPASQDPYGDPAGQFGNVRPASQDPYGDPADQEGRRFANVRPASEDPYGDPADTGR